MLFLRSIEERGYIVCAAEIVAQYLDVSSSSLLAAWLNFLAFNKPFDRLHLYSNFDFGVPGTIFERRFSARGNSCCFINWNCVDD